jgi:hypothetical protein
LQTLVCGDRAETTGAAAFADGETFTHLNGETDVTFEFNKVGV